MTDMHVIFGPPGTGKTTTLTRLVAKYVEEEGSDTVLLCAFTRAAARELAGRGMGLDAHQIGTIHSHCYHGLDCPPLAEAKYKAWNDVMPSYQISPQSTMDEGIASDLPGDQLLNTLNLNRHRLLPAHQWSAMVQTFAQRWTAWKHAHGYCDYTDLLEKGHDFLPIAPGHPRTIIVDEAQDLSPLQWQLMHQWGNHATRLIAAGDDDQCLYRWAGADFRPMLAAAHREVLPQSYRVPRSIQTVAMRYSSQIRLREPKTWQPRPQEGLYMPTSGAWQHPQVWLHDLRAWLEEPWGSIAVIAPCSYMLGPLLAELRSAGIPFSNRWRRRRHDWNPLAPPARGVGIVQRLRDFMKPADRLWTWNELDAWLNIVRAEGVLIRGAKAKVTLHAEENHVCTVEELQRVFLPSVLDAAVYGGTAWLEEHVLQTHAKTLAYPLRVLRQYGVAALTEEPRLTIGNCHSLKGAEADRVVFFMDLSRSQRIAKAEGGEGRDDVLRMLYVGVTRAKEELYVVEQY